VNDYIYIYSTQSLIEDFFIPKKIMCELCSVFENADEERQEQLESHYDTHLKNKKTVRQLKEIVTLNTRFP
jgi:predicted nucleic-acid-binding protein